MLDFSKKPVIGVVHLPPLPGSPLWDGNWEGLIERAIKDAKALEEGGVDAIIIENMGDKPFKIRVDYITVASMTRVALEVKREVSIPIGISLLRNSAPEAIAVANSVGAEFIRSNQWCWVSDSPEGLLTPVAREAWEVMIKMKRRVTVIADVRVKHAYPLSHRDLCLEASDLAERCLPDALAVTGPRTGEVPSSSTLATVRECIRRSVPIIIASGVHPEGIKQYWKLADGFIVGTYFKRESKIENEVDVERVRKLMRVVRELRGEG